MDPVTIDSASGAGGAPASAMEFAHTARQLTRVARRLGLAAPGFRSPPRLVGADRTLRRQGGRCIVSVRLRGRAHVAVVADMIEGVVAANGLTTPAADRARAAMWEAVTPTVEPVGSAPGTRWRGAA